MSKFNKSTKGKNTTVNKSGNRAYKLQDKEKLAAMVLTSLYGEEKFYGDNSKALVNLATVVDPIFVAKLALYARRKMNLRSVSHVLTAILANREDVKGMPLVRNLINQVVVRPDDITEILAVYLNFYGKPIPNALKKGLADKMGDMTEYGLGKYNGGKKEITFKDVIMLTHPKPRDIRETDLFKKVLEDTLETPYTWETELSEKGNTKEVWEDLIASGKVGYMALLRNLKNIIKAQPRNIQDVYDQIMDREAVLKSKQLPFRFYTAYTLLDSEGLMTSKLAYILNTALEYSTENIETLPGKTLIAVDSSGSMSHKISDRSSVSCFNIATIIAMMANKICEEAVTMSFDDSYSLLSPSRNSGIIDSAQCIPNHGGSTDIRLPFDYMLKEKAFFDRVIIISDNEMNAGKMNKVPYSGWGRPRENTNGATCQSRLDRVRKEINPDLWLHGIDLVGYGTQQFTGGKYSFLAGWNETVFDVIKYNEEGTGDFVSLIEGIGI